MTNANWDEVGDDGHNVAITRYFALSGIILADSNWKIFLEKMKALRQGFTGIESDWQ